MIQYGYQMKGLDLGCKNMLFIFQFLICRLFFGFHVCLHFVNINNGLFTF